jgi:TolA-binding protein
MKNCYVTLISLIFSVLILNTPAVAQDNSPENSVVNNAANNNKASLSEKQEKIYLNLAESLYNDGEYVRALSIYLDFLDLYPDSTYTVRAMETLADLYEKQQRYSEALSVYENLYQRTGPSSNKGIYYYYNQARVLNTMGYVEKASQIYSDIIKISPDSPYAKKAQINNKLNSLFD